MRPNVVGALMERGLVDELSLVVAPAKPATTTRKRNIRVPSAAGWATIAPSTSTVKDTAR